MSDMIPQNKLQDVSNIFPTVNDAVEFCRKFGLEVSPADKGLFHIALALELAYWKGRQIEMTINGQSGYSKCLTDQKIAEIEEIQAGL